MSSWAAPLYQYWRKWGRYRRTYFKLMALQTLTSLSCAVIFPNDQFRSPVATLNSWARDILANTCMHHNFLISYSISYWLDLLIGCPCSAVLYQQVSDFLICCSGFSHNTLTVFLLGSECKAITHWRVCLNHTEWLWILNVGLGPTEKQAHGRDSVSWVLIWFFFPFSCRQLWQHIVSKKDALLLF